MDKPVDTRREDPPPGASALPGDGTVASARPGLPKVPDLTRVLLDSMTEGVSLSAEDGTILYTNPAEDQMFGYGPGELAGLHVSVQNGYPPEENARIVGEVIAELKRTGAWRGEWLNRRKDGSTFFTTSRISALDIGGRPHWLCVQEDVTEQKQAAAELEASEARLALATEAAELGIWDWDVPTGRMTYSPRAKEICGFAPDREVTYDDARRVTHPEDYPHTSAMARRALDPGLRERQPYEYRVLRPDGSVRWVLANGEAVFAEVEGEMRAVRYVGTLQDVTERRRLEAARAANEARLRLAVEAGGMAVWELDLATDTVVGSPELNRLLGYPEDATPTAEELRARYYPGEQERIRAIGQAALARGERAIEVDYRYIRPDESLRWMMLRAEMVMDGSGRPLRAIGVIMDITDRKEAEAALRASNDRFRGAVDAVEGVIWTNDAEGRMSGDQPAWAALTGQTQEEYQGFGWAEAVHPDDAQPTVAAWHEALAARRTFVHEHRVRRQDGEWRLFSVRAIPVIATDGAVSEWVGVHTDITERRAAETAMAESEARLRAVVAACPFPIMLHAEDGEVLELSRKWTELTGYGREEIRTHFDWARLAYPDRSAAIGDQIAAEFARQGENAAGEVEIRARDGSTRIWDFYTVGLGRLPDGRKLQVSAAADITRRKRSEIALRASEERYRALFENIEAGFCIVEMMFDEAGVPIDYRLVELNPAFERQTGLHDAAGKWMSEAAPGLERHWFETYGRVARTGEAVRFENQAEPLGRWYDVLAFSTGAPAEHRVAILFNDITERRRAELRLRELNETLEQRVAETAADLDRVWRNASDIFVVIDGEGVFHRVNPATTALLGWTEVEMLGQRVFDFIHPDDMAPTLQALEHARGDVLPAFENRYRTASGGLRTIAWVAAPEGALIYAYGRDVTAAKEAAAELEAAQEALRQSQKMEAMGQLTGGVAHDFNNLLTPIVGSLDLLQRRGVGGEREQRMIAGAIQSADRAKTLVQRLLAFARRQPLQPTAVDVAALVTGMAELVSSTTGPQIKVVVDVPADLPAARADPNQLEMAILNLAVNARDAMSEGGTLRISAATESVEGQHRVELKPGPYVRLSVADTGAGMDAATLARAVEPFFSTKGIGKGTGLGLSMVHGLASQLGGALAITSRPSLGTNVELWLPVADAPAQAAEPVAGGVAERVTAGTALLVDDEELVRSSTADMLADLGYEVAEAASAEEALRLLDVGLAPDLVVTDHLMPGMNGTDFARLVQGRRPGTPVLIVSGYAESEGIAADLPRLTKPFRLADLAASLAELAH